MENPHRKVGHGADMAFLGNKLARVILREPAIIPKNTVFGGFILVRLAMISN